MRWCPPLDMPPKGSIRQKEYKEALDRIVEAVTLGSKRVSCKFKLCSFQNKKSTQQVEETSPVGTCLFLFSSVRICTFTNRLAD